MRRVLAILMLSLVLPGCGFKPMYGENTTTTSTSVMDRMASIDIRPIPDRLGQIVRNQLVDAITPTGTSGAPAYELALKIGEEREDVGLRQNASATRANYRMSAKFELREIASDKVVLSGTTWAETAFDIVQQDYPTVIAQQDAQKKLAIELAEEIKTRIAVFFDKGK
jgi:LPS-assembly lipoprotein